MRASSSRFATVAVALLATLCGRSALAESNGIAGFSGMAPGGTTCNMCHAGGVEPAVRFEGPTTLAPGEIGAFRFVVRSRSPAQTAAGFNVAASGGDLDVSPVQGAQRDGAELVQTGARGNDRNGEAAWDFTWQAPPSSGAHTLFGAGNSVNLDSGLFGDRSAATTLVVRVETPTPAPTSSPSPTRAPEECVGDCDGDGRIAISELIRGVNIALGSTDVGSCPDFDDNGNGVVSVNELVSAVNGALHGCIGAP